MFELKSDWRAKLFFSPQKDEGKKCNSGDSPLPLETVAQEMSGPMFSECKHLDTFHCLVCIYSYFHMPILPTICFPFFFVCV